MEYPALCLAWISSFCCLVNFANRNTPNNSGVQIIGGTSPMQIGHISPFLLRERQALIFLSLLLVLVDLHAGIHPADLIHSVFTLSQQR